MHLVWHGGLGLGSEDRDAGGGWIEGRADRRVGKRILGGLPRLPRGEGDLWAPGHGILDRVACPGIRTFDSCRTPKRGGLVTPRTLAESLCRTGSGVDLTAIVAALAAGEDHPGEPKTPPRTQSNEDLRCSAGGAQPDPAGKFAWSDEGVREAVTLLSGCTVRVQPGERLDVVDADPDDNRVLKCAVAAGSRFIVTGDGDLLRLGAYAGIRILKVADFLELIRETPA
jgi:hypothetical protein